MQHWLVSELRGSRVLACDGDVGSVVDVYFDDERQAVRYLVVDTGDWLSGHRVLVSPFSVAPGGREPGTLRVDLSREQIRNSPTADADMPVSRQFEEAHAQYYGYPFYWDGPYLWGNVQQPVGGTRSVTLEGAGRAARGHELVTAEDQARRSHLRSSEEVIGYRVVTPEGPIGHVDDLEIDDDWAVATLVVDTRDWLPDKKVAVPTATIREIDWATREVRLQAGRSEVEHAPKAP